MEQVEIEYVPEKAEVLGDLEDEFRKVFEKFTFRESAAFEENAVNAISNKKASSDSEEEEEQDDQKKEKDGISNKKKKVRFCSVCGELAFIIFIFLLLLIFYF